MRAFLSRWACVPHTDGCAVCRKVLGTVQPGEEVVALSQGFDKKGDARLQTEAGWVSFSKDGFFGTRFFVLVLDDKPERTGKLRFHITRAGASVVVTILAARGLRKTDLIDKNDVYVAVNVDGERKRTKTLKDAGANAVFGRKHRSAIRLALPQHRQRDTSVGGCAGARRWSLSCRPPTLRSAASRWRSTTSAPAPTALPTAVLLHDLR